jgi:hypothetical protein
MGWRPVMVDGVKRYTRCDHSAGENSGGFKLVAPDAAFRLRLNEEERRIYDLVLSRVGRQAALTIRGIIDRVWPQGLVARSLQEEKDCEREVKRVIARLRDEGKCLIIGTKGSPAGYFLPASQQECDDYHDELLSEAVDRIRLSQRYHRDDNLVGLLERALERAGT